jgi:hypothetical protein
VGADWGDSTACPHCGKNAASPISARQFPQVVGIADLPPEVWKLAVNPPI